MLLYHMYGGWFADGWLGHSWLLVLAVMCVSKFSSPGGGLYYYYFISCFTIVAGFGTYREYEDSSSSGLIDIMLKFHLEEYKIKLN